MSDFKGIILAAGTGTRMRSSLPKVLHTLSGRPILTYVINSLVGTGIQDIITVVPAKHHRFKSILNKTSQIAVQETPKGSGHALLQAIGMTSTAKNILVLNGDMPLIKKETLISLMTHHQSSEADLTLLTAHVSNPKSFGRIVRNEDNRIITIIEESEANESHIGIKEINAGAYCFKTSWLGDALKSLKPSKSGEFFLTDLISLAYEVDLKTESLSTEEQEILGVNNKKELAKVDKILRTSICEDLMAKGVTIIDPDTTYIGIDVSVEQDTVIYPNTHISGVSKISSRCEVGPNSVIANSSVGPNCIIRSSTIESAIVCNNVTVGPYSHIREGTFLKSDVKIGNYVEIKNSAIGNGTKLGHHCYIGDSDIGSNVNIGAGTITCNYDGLKKQRTTIKDNAFIGSDTKLIAPVIVGIQSITGAGSVITKDIPDFAKGVGSPARIIKEDRSS
jgi:bifunctional UDP-N-acetylglucosamine pyrophosphorylase/glucosamine-1-phosphate N-acetyltransferase